MWMVFDIGTPPWIAYVNWLNQHSRQHERLRYRNGVLYTMYIPGVSVLRWNVRPVLRRPSEVVMISDIIVKDAGSKGLGVFALRDFTKGEFIFRRRHGAIVRNQDIELLSEEDQRRLCELDWETSAVL